MRILATLLMAVALIPPGAALAAEHAGCAATPEAAAKEAVGAATLSSFAPNGYRVEAAEFDAVMGSIWLRVQRCGAPEAPPVLIPLHVKLANIPTAARRDAGPQAVRKPIEVHAGDAVRVFFFSSAMQVELEATADTQAAAGDPIDVTLRRRSDEPLHRMHGILRADHRVEVQP